MARLINLGSLCVDQVYRVKSLATAGETVVSLSHQTFAGGKGLNQSLAASRAGAEVCQFGCVGTDGGMLLEVLEAASVNVSGVRMLPDRASGHAVIQVDERGANAIVIVGGANRALTGTDWDAALGVVEVDDWLLLQNEINDLGEVLRRAADLPGRVALNLAPVDGREREYDLSGVDLLIVNEIEARALVASSTATLSDIEVVREIATRYPEMDVLLTAGARGLLHARGDRILDQPAFQVQAVDETAAGDAFIGYLLAALLNGDGLEAAILRGAAAGALAVTRPGAATSIPEREKVDAFLKARGFSV